MSIFIYNSLTRKKEEFIPLNPSKVNIYTCGVTVYDESHIGHARSLYIFDVIRRYLKYRGFEVRFVRNITDIDDKIINRANELKKGYNELVDKYIKRYYEDLESLGLEKADVEPRATENIPEMIKYIQLLIENGFAYASGGDVYFNVRKFTPYGKLSGQSIDQMYEGVRVEKAGTKKDPLDFALWKKSKEGEPFWESPLGKGRPGWHIECSVMAQKFLKVQTLDIHAGGRDLIFPHHENEIAQAEALTGKPFAKYWIHHGLLTINGQKMSKSLGNFVTIKNFMAKHKNADLLKLFFLSTHYSHPIDYSEERIEEVKKQRIHFDLFFDLINTSQTPRGKKKPVLLEKDKLRIDNLFLEFLQAIDNDFNTAEALACLFELVDYSSARESTFEYVKSKVNILFEIFGLKVKPKPVIPQEDNDNAHLRIREKENKNFPMADKIREEEAKKGFYIIDTGVNFSFTTTLIPPSKTNDSGSK